MAADYSIKVWTEKSTYHVGENWTGVFWNPDGWCTKSISPGTTLIIDGPSTHMVEFIPFTKLPTGSYMPSIGRPWVAANVGSWTLTFSINGGANSCLASGTASFKVAT